MMNCIICNCNSKMSEHLIREKMFGTFEEFTYLQCENCKVLKLKNVIQDYSPYYNESYYSLLDSTKKDKKGIRLIKKVRLIFSSIKYLKVVVPASVKPSYFSWITRIGLGFNKKILEVGCGKGRQLFVLYNNGYNNLYGIDPFIKQDIENINIHIKKCDLFNYTESNFDLIIFNHSLEHIENHQMVLLKAIELLNKNGRIIIRTPIIGRSFDIYKSNWVEIDAPRHVIIHSMNSMQILLKGINLKINEIIYDTDEFEFWGSEQFCNNIATNSKRSFSVNPSDSMFSKRQMDCYKVLASDYNKRGIAGRACFIIEKLK
jgi:SAM-dependent methyltransferase